MNDALLTTLSGLSFLFGLFCIFWVKKRQFDRTNKYGKEQFPSFSGKIKTGLGDMALWTIAIVSIGFGALYWYF